VQLASIIFNGFRVQNLPVVLADVEILVILLRQHNLLVIVSKLEIRHVVFRLF